MAKRELPSPEVLRQLLRYEPETGKLFWKERAPEHYPCGFGRYTAARSSLTFNIKHANREAGCLDESNGYLRLSILGSKTYAHRAIWAIETECWPDYDIDHINGCRTDNRLANLRAVDRHENTKNQRLRSTNTSGRMGVKKIQKTGRWRSGIMVDGVSHHIGVYATFDEASEARTVAEREFGFHENHGRQ